MFTMSLASVPVFQQMLGGLDKILDKLAHHCEAKKIDPSVFLNARLYPDMFTFTRQVQIASDFAKGAMARLSGREVPVWPDDEKTIADLKARIAKTLAFVNSIPVNELDDSAGKTITGKFHGRNGPETHQTGHTYLVTIALPNFYFHVTTAYALLRHGGLEIGKRDYLGGA